MLYAGHKHSVLIVLQAMDTGGKDGTIRNVLGYLNPQGVRIINFKSPTQEELDHDFLWRIHQHIPGKGQVIVFNRSHYEDVLIVRVHNLVPKKVWSKRYRQINDFEKMLTEEGTTILKFYLHISKEEQRKRLQARLDDPAKNWKFTKNDVKERGLWDKYMEAFEDALTKTSTKWAPRCIVPADRKWYRDLVVSTVISDAFEGLGLCFPEPEENIHNTKLD